MTNLKKKLTIATTIFFFSLILLNIKSYAGVSLSQSSVSMKEGETTTVQLSATDATGNISVSSSNSSVATASAPNWIENNTITITITAKSAGNASISITGIVADSSANETNVSKSISVTVTGSGSGGNTSNNGGNSGNSGNNNGGDTTSKSNNANLKNLGITPNDFKGFKANTTTYNVTVPYDVEAVTVYAQAQDSKASVSGTGKKRLKEGSNSLQVVVTAEDGTKKTYTINVVRTSDAEEMTPNVIDENNEEANKPESLRLTAISLQNDLNLTLLPAFNSETFEYTVEVANDLEKLELSGIPNVNGAKVIIEGNDQLDSEENIITITVKADGYEDVIYKIKVIKKAEEKQEEQALELVDPVDLDNSRATMKIIIISAVATFIIIAIIIILVLKRKKDKKRLYSSYYDYYNDYPEESEKVDLIKEMENKGSGEKETRKNIFEDDMNNSNEETPEGYTVEIEADTDVAEKPRRKRGKGKHF